MKNMPTYKKWFNGLPVEPTVEVETSTVVEGQIFAFGSASHNQAPPTNGENYDFTETINIPWREDEQGNPKPILTNLRVSYRVEDWGDVYLDDELLIDLTSREEGVTGQWGGHTAWKKSKSATIASGEHTLEFSYQNITMSDPNMNQIICEYSYKAVVLESGGKKDPRKCPCSGNTCSPEGGQNPPGSQGIINNTLDSSSAGTDVVYKVTDDSMVWSCNMGVLRGLGTKLSGRVQLYTDKFDASLASPAALYYNHPMLAKLIIPEVGVVPGAKLEIHMGDRVIALRYYLDGSIAPIGVDSAGNGRASLTLDASGAVVSVKWQDNSGAAWVFNGSSGELVSYTGPEMVVVDDVSDYLVVKKSTDETHIRQIWSLWDGLMNIEEITTTGYKIRLYTPSKVTGIGEDGYYTVTGINDAFKTFAVTYAESGLTIVETTPGREDYSCTWSKGEDGAWSIAIGSEASEMITSSRVRTVIEPAETAGFEVWQMVTTVSKGNVPASCVCEVYQNSPMGNLLLTRVEGYGSVAAQTTTFEYDGVGNLIAQISPNGHKVEYCYDLYGRVIKRSEPWRAGNYKLITDYSYANTSDSRYSSEISAITQWLRQDGATSMTKLSTETHTYSVSNGIKREEIRTTAAGSSHTHLEVTETWTNDAANSLDKGRIRMTQGNNGVQTWYTYESTTSYGAIYTITTETRVNEEAVAGQSRRTVKFINAAGNTVREEEYILLTSGTWEKINGTTHSYNTQNQLTGSMRDNGRSFSQELSCTGAMLWQVDEDGVRTDYTYDSARQLTEISRSAVYDGEVCVTPETITEFVRDAAGRVTSTITRIGSMTTTSYTVYDLAGRKVSETDLLNRETTTEYSTDGLTTTTTTPSGATLITTLNTDGSVAHVYGTGQRELYYVYDISGSNVRETVKLADNQTTLSQSISNGFGESVVEVTASTSGFIYTRNEYNTKGQLTKSYQDTGWNTTPTAATLFEYDTMGNITKKTLALDETPTSTNSPIEEYSYGAESLEDGVYATVIMTRYNAAGDALTSEQKQMISALSTTIESKSVSINERNLTSAQWTAYNGDAKKVTYSSIPTSTITAETVTVDGFVVSRKDNAGITSTAARSYATSGMTISHTDGRGNTTTTVTDIAGRAIRVTDAAGNSSGTTYCTCCDRPAIVTDALNNTSCYRYDERGRKIAEWGTGIQPVCYAYDSADRLVSLTTFRVADETISSDPTGRTDGDTTTWGYHDASGMETSKTYADGKGVTKTYDAYNRLLTETDGRGVVKTHSYEQARGLLLGTTYSDGTAALAYSYNHLGMLTQVTDEAGTRTIGYNAYNEQETDSLLAGGKTHLVMELRDDYGRSSGYTYALNGSVQQTVSTGYGSDGRIASAGFVHGGAQKLFTYSYLPGTNLLQTLVKPNNMTLTQSYEEKRDLLIDQLYKRSNTSVASRAYTYDTLGRPVTRSTSKDGSTVNDSFGYNSRSELNAATVNNKIYVYDYDNIGNRETAQEAAGSVTSYESNNLNQYTAIGDFEPTYDDAGNQTTVKTNTGIWTVVYNAENRPTSFTNADSGTIVECLYDYMGRRATKKVTVNGSVTLHQRFLYRGHLQIACCDLTRSNHPCLWLITWDPSQPIATRPLAIQKDGTWYTYGWDLTKNICEVYGQHGYIRTNYSYSPYGEVTISGDVTQPIQWSSEYSDSEIDLVYYNYRHYIPVAGKWLSRDLIKESTSINVYKFAQNTLSFDILGLMAPGALGAQVAANYGNNYGQGNVTIGLPREQKKEPNTKCKVHVCCKPAGFVFRRGHCVIRFTYTSGAVRGCRGGPTRNDDSGGSSVSWGSSHSGAGSSDSSANVGTGSNSQNSFCKGCCGYWGNVVAGCDKEIKPPYDALTSGINSDLENAHSHPSRCTLIATYTDVECQAKQNCVNSYMRVITNKCYIYKPLGNNSNTSWRNAFKSCFKDLPVHDPALSQPGNDTFNETERCHK